MNNANMLDYDKYIVAFSGGKDSTACFLHLLDCGIPKDRIELWHHDVDGNDKHFFDWPITKDYCKKFAKAFGVEIYFSWKKGGFLREMLRDNELTAPTHFETPTGIKVTGGTSGKKSTRRKFPQISPNLSVRWCSAYLKIDICATSIRNQKRFDDIKTIVLSGERGEESKARAGYAINEPDRSDLRNGKTPRYVDRWRPLRDWREKQVWEIIEKYKVRVHPCYYLGFSRCSCMHCIFVNKNQFATSAKIDPIGIKKIIDLEKEFCVTMKRDVDLKRLIDTGTPYPALKQNELLSKVAMTTYYPGKIFTQNWKLPSGAYGESCGPT